MCNIRIDMKPIPQARHRSSTRHGKVFQYDPSHKDKKKFALLVSNEFRNDPFNGDISVSLTFGIPRPKKHYRTGKYSHKLKNNSPVFVRTKPDIDNLIKFVMDACNKVLWKDDCCIVEIQARKMYTDKPFTDIEVWHINEAD
jgi:Holliday junction resolvase RusA-like endonuclease